MKKVILFILIVGSVQFVQAKVYAVIVGVSRYYNASSNLLCSSKDAIDFFHYQNKINPLQSSNDFILLTDSIATKENILAALQIQFSKATEADKVIFFFSGHGFQDGIYVYGDLSFDRYLYHSSIRDAFKKCKAKIKLCLADACFSGGIKPKQNDTVILKSKNQYNKQMNNLYSGVIVFMSSRGNQTSIEAPAYNNSIFTYYMLKAFNGECDDNKDHIITAIEMYSYVRKNVLAFTSNRQTPVMYGNFSADLPIGTY